MMDIYCPVCGEPYEIDALHDLVPHKYGTFNDALHEFQSQGCVAVDGRHNDTTDEDMAEAAQMVYDLLGDDVDGAAAMLEDFGMGF